MRIDVRRCRYVTMSQDILYHLHLDSHPQQQRCRRVPQIMKPLLWKPCFL